MLSSITNQDLSDSSDPPTSPSPESGDSGIHTEQMFRLIDSILPFEACLYYQFLPLALEGRYLRLGMVSLHDSSALDYVRHILAYLNCSLKTEPISAEALQSRLSAYLKYAQAASSSRKQASEESCNVAHREQLTPTVNDLDQREPDEQSDDALSPSAFQQLGGDNRQPPLAPPPTSPLHNDSTLTPKPPTSQEASPSMSLVSIPKVSLPVKALPPLEVQAVHLSQPIEFIATLRPQQLLQELLGRVLISGIGRLYFERQPDCGRILWSQEGVLQCVLEGLSLPVFQGVIIELKRFVNLPLLPVIQPKQVEIERRYQQEGLLLRLRVMPGTYGEEATLQVLRGVALKFYQRQQLEKLSQEALHLAQQLQQKLNEIRDRSSRYPMPLEVLPALNQLLQGFDQQLEALAELPTNQSPDK